MEQTEYKTILIIGNGFDLNLGLQTGYNDFISSSIFNQLLEKENQLCIYLKNQHELNTWIDIENELKNYSNNIYKSIDRKVFRLEYQELCKSLCEYLNSLDVSCIDETSRVYKILTDDISNFDNVLILNYNYTSSINYILNQRDLKYKILKVHGSAKNKKIVFGVEDKARINYHDVFLKKSTCLWNEILDIESLLSKANNIIFLGYSLGETDHHYFKSFFQSASYKNVGDKTRKDITISYYEEDGMYNIWKQIDDMTGNRIQELRTHQNFSMFDLAKSENLTT